MKHTSPAPMPDFNKTFIRLKTGWTFTLAEHLCYAQALDRTRRFMARYGKGSKPGGILPDR